MSTISDTTAAAWGEHTIPLSHARHWRLGDLGLTVQRLHAEWRARARYENDDTDGGPAFTAPENEPPMEGDDVTRFGTGASGGEVRIEPVLADRAFVTRPEVRFQVPSGHAVTLYVSTPLWARLTLIDGATLLAEIPTTTVHRTWFGPSPREGEVLYAARTACRLAIEDVPRMSHRVLTAVHVVNRATTPLTLERMELPVPYLTLYRGTDGQHWTQDLTLRRPEDGDLAEFRPHDTPPRHAPGASVVWGPRSPMPKHHLFRAFASLFS